MPEAGLARANARLLAAYLVGNQVAAKPFGAWLFVAAPALPFALAAARKLAAALLLAPLLGRHGSAPRPEPRSRGTLPAEIVQGLGWLWRHRTLRLLALCVGVMNLAGAGSFAIWVLWARERLGVQGVGFGALVTAYTAGGLLGTMLVGPLERRFGPATLLRAGLGIEAASQLSLALARSPWVAGPTLVAFGAHATVWGVVSVSLRRASSPRPTVAGSTASTSSASPPPSGSARRRWRCSPWPPGAASGTATLRRPGADDEPTTPGHPNAPRPPAGPARRRSPGRAPVPGR